MTEFQKKMAEGLFDVAMAQAQYAINSKSRHLVYQAYGFANGLVQACGITTDQFWQLNEMLVKNCMNNGPVWSTFNY